MSELCTGQQPSVV